MYLEFLVRVFSSRRGRGSIEFVRCVKEAEGLGGWGGGFGSNSKEVCEEMREFWEVFGFCFGLV